MATGLLALPTVDVGDLVRARGLVNGFGMAPADFNARTVVDVDIDSRAALLHLGWMEPTATALTSIAPERIDVDLADARVALKLRGVPQAFIDELQDLALVAPETGRGIYALRVRGVPELHLFRSFADLVDEILEQLAAGNLLHRITAQGQYNVDLEELTVRRAGFVFEQPGENS